MLIWLNGPFGGGKRQTAHELSHRLPTSVVCDPVTAPMTVINPTYFKETVGRLRDMDHEVHHFSLLARRETVLKRLRGLPLGRNTWAESTVDECLSRLQTPEFATHVWTDNLTIPEVADHIATAAAVTLTPNTDTRLQAYARPPLAARARCATRPGSIGHHLAPAVGHRCQYGARPSCRACGRT